VAGSPTSTDTTSRKIRNESVIDERFNGGGWIADYIVDWLNRPLLMAAMTREARTITSQM